MAYQYHPFEDLKAQKRDNAKVYILTSMPDNCRRLFFCCLHTVPCWSITADLLWKHFLRHWVWDYSLQSSQVCLNTSRPRRLISTWICRTPSPWLSLTLPSGWLMALIIFKHLFPTNFPLIDARWTWVKNTYCDLCLLSLCRTVKTEVSRKMAVYHYTIAGSASAHKAVQSLKICGWLR
jgi:hypothetical protein